MTFQTILYIKISNTVAVIGCNAITGDNYPFAIFKLFLRAANISIKTPQRYTKHDLVR